MRFRIRSKLIMAITLLIVVLFTFVAFLFINEKKIEMADDIYLNALAFSKLTASTIANNYDLYLAQGGFVYFNREMQDIFEQNDDIALVEIVSYEGEVLYDSEIDVDKKYQGEPRMIEDSFTLRQIQSEHVSIRTFDGEILYLKTDEKGNTIYVDENENRIEPLESGSLINFIVVPANERYSIVYGLDYHNLFERIEAMTMRIVYLAIFGVMLGMIMSFIMARQVTKPVSKLVKGAEKIATGDFKTRVYIKTRDELGFLGKAFNKMAVDLEASVEAKLYKERVARELELAAQIQNQLVPDESQIPKVEGLDIAAGLIPAEEMGGDMYDFLCLNDERMLMYLGDVTGHGVPAGIVGSIASAVFFGYCAEIDLKKLIIDVNRVLKAKTMTNMFMTLCLMEWSVPNKRFRYVSAGHEQLIHYKAAEGKAELTPAGGIALGMLPDVSAHVKVEEVNLEPGDFIIVYSDGIPEAWRSKNENYGIKRFMRSVEKWGNAKNSNEMKGGILADLKEFTGDYKQMDDITLVVIKRI
ncbi:SpoIIE family protein phosphatase [Candidatus Peregrinibacteria bacterium]|nr:SpoIIE family protein phosphatase [Candidatus Peregrinibacteria bacterium]